MNPDPTKPLNETEEAPMTEADALRKGPPPLTPEQEEQFDALLPSGDYDEPGDDPEPYGYEPTPDQEKAQLIGLVTRGRPFVLITVMGQDEDGHPQAAVDAAGLDLVAAYAITNEVAGALSQQISQLRIPRPELIVP